MSLKTIKKIKSFEVTKKILLVEDSVEISDLIDLHLKSLDYQIDKAYDGNIGLEKASINQYSLIILDLFLPGKDGIEICQTLRQSGDSTPILILSARAENTDKIRGFKTGANAYLTKPFNLKSLSNCVKDLIENNGISKKVKKQNGPSCNIQIFKDFTIDTVRKVLVVKGKLTAIEEKEYQLLCLLVCNPGMTYSRSEILKHIWGFDLKAYRYKVTSYISKIRQKIEPNFQKPKYILASLQGGFKFNEKILPLKHKI